jgi:hypothetical protein
MARVIETRGYAHRGFHVGIGHIVTAKGIYRYYDAYVKS